MTASLPRYRPRLAAGEVDQALRASLAAVDDARSCALLWFHEVLHRRLYRDLGHPSMEQYAIEALGFSRNRTWQFLRLARDLERLPPLREAVVDGRLGWTKAQQVARLATADSVSHWVDVAARCSRRELTAVIERVRRAAAPRDDAASVATDQPEMQLPDRPAHATTPSRSESPPRRPAAAVPPPRATVTLTLDSADLARLEAMLEAAKKAGAIPATATREQALLAALDQLVAGPEAGDLRRRNTAAPYRVVMYRCGACGRAAVVTGRGRRPVATPVADAIAENAVVHRDGRNRHAIPPAVRASVLARDGHRCRAPGCGSVRFLELHHLVPRERGGTNLPENLVTLCSRCHRFLHARGLRLDAGMESAFHDAPRGGSP